VWTASEPGWTRKRYAWDHLIESDITRWQVVAEPSHGHSEVTLLVPLLSGESQERSAHRGNGIYDACDRWENADPAMILTTQTLVLIDRADRRPTDFRAGIIAR
jgi:hypothetical protein